VVSRGELVEIGDGFRIPDLLVSTGARLREVGTTNRVTLADYRGALGPDTGAVLKVHPSNFVVRGFTRQVEVGDLAAALDGTGTPLVADIGSGLLRPHPLLPEEPDIQGALAAGADLVLASGDKLLGGPQAGLVLGRAELVQRLRRHPLYRALRVDKTTLAALEATLRGPLPPVQEMLAADVDGLRERARVLATRLAAGGVDAVAVDAEARVGGGGAPEHPLPGAAVSLPASFAEPLRRAGQPVVGYLDGDRTLLNLRSLLPSDDDALATAVLEVGRRWT
jgi:L-seryl-tRNA(Ser) seleniumtransferase